MITTVEFQNFKAIERLQLELGRLTVLVGPNASGKSSVLEGMHLLSQLLDKTPEELFVGRHAPWLVHRWPAATEMVLRFDLRNVETFRLVSQPSEYPELGRREIDESTPPAWEFYRQGMTFHDHGSPLELRPWEELSSASQSNLREDFSNAVLLRLDAERLGTASYSDRLVPRVEYDGSGLPSALAYLRLKHEDRFESVVDALRSVVPGIRAVNYRREKVYRTESELITVGDTRVPVRREREFWGDALMFDTTTGSNLPGHLASEGTLLALGLLTVTMGPDCPHLVLLDDIDRALHPNAQIALVELLRKVLDQNPELQIVATSHSPYFLDALEPDEVRLTHIDEQGRFSCGALSDHPEFDRWKNEMRPGEFWSVVGERWLSEAEPVGSGR